MGALFGGGGGGAMPPPPPAPPPAANPPTLANAQVAAVGASQRARAAAAAGAGFGDTIKNQGGAQGLVKPADTAPRTLLG